MAVDEGNGSLEQLDREIFKLLEQRVALLEKGGGKHARPNDPLLDAVALNLSRDEIKQFWWHLHSLAQRAANKLDAVCYLGPIYSFSYLAAVKHFGIQAELVPVTTIAASFEEVVRGQSDFAVVPIENSTDGRIVDTLGMFAKTPAKICGEVFLPIHHCLLAKCGRSEIKEVQSKPQAISQCRDWLSEHLPHAKLTEVASTTKAAEEAARTPGVAAVASMEAGVHHGLDLVESNIEDNPNNVTRFAVIGNSDPDPTGKDKTSLMFQLEHRPGGSS